MDFFENAVGALSLAASRFIDLVLAPEHAPFTAAVAFAALVLAYRKRGPTERRASL